MGIGGRTWRKLAMTVAVPGVAIGALAGFGAAPAMAGMATSHEPPFQNEKFHGSVAGENSVIPIWASGDFSDSGVVDLNGPNPGYHVHLQHGSLLVSYSNGVTSSHLAPESCTMEYTVTFDYTVTGGTGRYRHASGSGSARARTTMVLRRLHNGTCDPEEPMPGSIFTVLDAHGPFTLYGA